MQAPIHIVLLRNSPLCCLHRRCRKSSRPSNRCTDLIRAPLPSAVTCPPRDTSRPVVPSLLRGSAPKSVQPALIAPSFPAFAAVAVHSVIISDSLSKPVSSRLGRTPTIPFGLSADGFLRAILWGAAYGTTGMSKSLLLPAAYRYVSSHTSERTEWTGALVRRVQMHCIPSIACRCVVILRLISLRSQTYIVLDNESSAGVQERSFRGTLSRCNSAERRCEHAVHDGARASQHPQARLPYSDTTSRGLCPGGRQDATA
ncbi:hypothetical protein BDV95DRAFT_192924 [Massariosphaeria phaeospora]|uniref:Uncharacterized protein n=1 Tax=Massariosphaeria phaeospora TaxID=100035 RepID=A0A7C8MDW0_9PLEO|nr:hypothetical protein BDV95DRAFT_192924 [Massariosphaeria phaeospora]